MTVYTQEQAEQSADETTKELRLPVIEVAVMNVQGYKEPQLTVQGQMDNLMDMINDA